MENSVQEIAGKMVKNISQVMAGKEEEIKKVLVAFLSGGHVLLEDMPGTGKTTLAKALALSVSCDFKRIQFTPDLLPSDVTGIHFYNQKREEFVLKMGPVFTNILLADEINRATPRTQSSLLECMEERQVSIDGESLRLEEPFMVIATQNPIEIQGTFPLPEAQLDRFLMRLRLGYPARESEKEILQGQNSSALNMLEPVVTQEEVIEAQKQAQLVQIGDAVGDYIISIVEATRCHDKIRLGVSPRGMLSLARAVKTYAAMQGRDFAVPDDVKAVAADVCAHRILCKGTGSVHAFNTQNDIIESVLNTLPVPREREIAG